LRLILENTVPDAISRDAKRPSQTQLHKLNKKAPQQSRGGCSSQQGLTLTRQETCERQDSCDRRNEFSALKFEERDR
jgi:hypothetical protein